MPIVEVNGQELEFPDDMTPDQIKSVLQKKFPTQQAPQQAQVQQQLPIPERPQPTIPNPMDMVGEILPEGVKSTLGRTGRILTGIAGGVVDLPVTVGQLSYDATRGIQNNMGARVSPEYKIPLPSEGLKSIYDMATNNAGRATGDAAAYDKLAEVAAPLGALAAKAGPEIVRQLIPKAKGATKQLAQRALELGIPLRVDQIVPSRAMNTAQKVSQEIPFSGVDASEAAQVQAFNSRLAKTIGQDADNLGPEVILKFKDDASVKFGDLLKGAKISVETKDLNKLKNIKQMAPQYVGANSLSVVNSNVNQALKDLSDKNISGEKLANIRSYFLKNISYAEGGAKKFIGEIINIVDDMAARNVSPDRVKALAEARREWRNFRTLEPLLEKSVDGNINPTELLNQVKASRYIKASTKKVGDDELVDLARIGKHFLAKKGGSDTFQKSVAGGGVGALGVTAVTNPVLAIKGAALAGTGIGLNRGLQALNSSEWAARAALNNNVFNPNISNALAAIGAGAINK